MRGSDCFQGAKAVARVGGACGPSGSSGCRSGGFLFALFEAETLAVHFKDMDVMGHDSQFCYLQQWWGPAKFSNPD